MHHITIGFLAGLLAFPHCLGMCGGFILHLAERNSRRSAIIHQLMWLLGKTFTYTFSGAVAGYAGARLAVLLQHIYLQNLVSFIAGSLLLVAGIKLLGFWPIHSPGDSTGHSLWASVLGPLVHMPTPAAAAALGIFCGFLPCPIVIGLLAYAMQSSSVSIGMTTMAAMGIGTMFPLLTLGGASSLAVHRLRMGGAKAAGIILFLLGGATVLRGTDTFHSLFGCPPIPAFQQLSRPSTSRTCCPDKINGTSNHH